MAQWAKVPAAKADWSLPPGAHVVIGENRLLQAGPCVHTVACAHGCVYTHKNK